VSSDEDIAEWRPPEKKAKAPSKTTRVPAAGEKKASAKRPAKPKVPKEPKAPKVPRNPKPRAPRKPTAERKTQASESLKDSAVSGLTATKRKMTHDYFEEDKGKTQTDGPDERNADESGSSIRMKAEVSLNTLWSMNVYTVHKRDSVISSSLLDCSFD